MRLFSVLFDWFCQRLFWLCVLAAAGSTVRADVILWDQPVFTGSTGSTGFFGFGLTNPGQTRSQAIDLSQAAVLHSLSLNLGRPSFLAVGSGNYDISLWLDSTPAERRTLIYSGVFQSSWSGLAIDLPKGRSWISVENLPTSTTISWISPSGTTGGAFTAGGVTTLTEAYAGQAIGVYVPEPSMGIAAGVAVCVMGAIGFFRRMKRGNKCSGTR